MKALLLKDFYVTLNYGRAFFFIVAVFAVFSAFADGNMFFMAYPCMIAGMLPSTLIAYDEKEKWDLYAHTLPYTRKEMVSSKYAIGMFASLAVVLLMSAVQGGKMLSSHLFHMSDWLMFVLLLASVSLLFPALFLPFLFRLGYEKGQIAYYIILGVTLVGSMFFFRQDHLTRIPSVSGLGIMFLVFCIAVLLYISSWLLSIRFYQKREF